jgi:hypothetical protein
VAEDSDLPDAQVIQQRRGVPRQQLETVVNIRLGRFSQPIWSGATTRYPDPVSASMTSRK